MPPRLAALFCRAACLGSLAAPAQAGAFLPAEGYGQFIAGVGVSEGTRTFDNGGRPQPSPAYRQLIASGYLEYGLTSWLTAVAAPALAHTTGGAGNTVTGSDSSAFGARLKLYQSGDRALAIQTLVQPPLAPGSAAAQLASGGARNLAVDVRLMAAQSFAGGRIYVELAPGARVRADPFPSEVRFDATLGLRPLPSLLVLLQNFVSVAPPGPPAVARTTYDKLQASLVYDISARWSVQVGAFRTVAGVNAERETGPFGALWFRF